jgi:hypothetical protein
MKSVKATQTPIIMTCMMTWIARPRAFNRLPQTVNPSSGKAAAAAVGGGTSVGHHHADQRVRTAAFTSNLGQCEQ